MCQPDSTSKSGADAVDWVSIAKIIWHTSGTFQSSKNGPRRADVQDDAVRTPQGPGDVEIFRTINKFKDWSAMRTLLRSSQRQRILKVQE